MDLILESFYISIMTSVALFSPFKALIFPSLIYKRILVFFQVLLIIYPEMQVMVILILLLYGDRFCSRICRSMSYLSLLMSVKL